MTKPHSVPLIAIGHKSDTVKPPYMDTSLKWTLVGPPRAIFAVNEPLECEHLSILDCGQFFPVSFVVKNLFVL